jgi:2-polyprenyl-6-methoxyphenol hydroxylase-like FAD-dependent oxidoreductase
VTKATARVAIAGGGIGGLAAALALARQGLPTVVLEQASEFREIGAGLQVAPNALHVLDALGVGERVKRSALLIERMLMRDAVTGETVVDIPCDDRFKERFGNPYALAHRADVHGALLDACKSTEMVELRTNSKVQSFSVTPGGVFVRLADGTTVQASGLIGADGVNSTVRECLVNDGPPLTSGFQIYRAAIPAERMPQRHRHAYPLLWAGPNSHVIYYPMRDRSVFNFGATVMTNDSVRKAGETVMPDEMLGLFNSYHPESLEVMSLPEQFQTWTIQYRHPIERWSFGHVTLLGDAAHPMTQFLAQGAAMALEDAACIARCVAESADVQVAFERYQELRLPRTARAQISALMIGRLFHAQGIERKVRNEIFRDRTVPEHYQRLAWLYDKPAYV